MWMWHIGYVTVKNLNYEKINSANPLYLIIDKVNGYIEESNGNKYFALVPSDESKEILKRYENLQSRIKNLLRPITNKSDDYDEKYMILKFNLDDDLPPKKTLKLYDMVMVCQICLGNKCYLQVLSR